MRSVRRSGTLGRRLFAAFLLVALASVAVLTAAALVGTDQGLASARQSEREQTARRTAAAAYTRAGAWTGADLGQARALAAAAGAILFILDAGGDLVASPSGMGPGRGLGRSVGC